jgi:hypothetical protein
MARNAVQHNEIQYQNSEAPVISVLVCTSLDIETCKDLNVTIRVP